ncbi:hypothetical protein ACEN2J_05045 [Pseudorhodobacter sp. W20_MBD10_FR17]|uniref:hypothetical protein n=1 Tax=Pseudorhodobacter sp. W20_MBD10_FR17 TaxID=3240266 RepID=UPI003F9DE16D
MDGIVMRWFLAVLLCWVSVLSAEKAQAGAWPRDKGQFFVALSADQLRSQIYAEYGFGKDWTLGNEVSMPQGRRLPDVSQFIQHPVWRGKGGAILSAGVAAELRETTAATAFPALKGVSEIAVRAGLFWGKGFESRFGNGWATVDAQVEHIVTTDWLGQGLAYKLDMGMGVQPTERLKLMAQAQYWRRGTAQTMRLEASAALALGPTQVVVSPSIGVIGAKSPRVKLGLWVEF